MTRAHVMSGSVEYVFSVLLTNHSYDRLEVKKFDCSFPWPTKLIWPIDPQIHSTERQAYRLPSGREFPCEKVLNPHTGQSVIINPGGTLEGILLAFRQCQGLPIECFAGSVIPAELSIVDRNRGQHVSQIEIEVDRTAITTPLMQVRPLGQGLYGPAEVHGGRVLREQAFPPSAAEISSDIPDKRVTSELPRY